MAQQQDTVAKPPARRFGYQPQLDGWRGVAVMAVLLFHARLLHGGLLGVDMFFVLSGFLITSLLIAEKDRRGDVSLRNFYVRRVLRLEPALVLVSASVLIAAVGFLHGAERSGAMREVVLALTQTRNIAEGFAHIHTGFLGHTWSLALEEQFYLVWPPTFVVVAVRWRRSGWLVPLLVAGIVLICGQRLLRLGPLSSSNDLRADVILWGCLLAMCIDARGTRRILLTRGVTIPLAVLLAIALFNGPDHMGFEQFRIFVVPLFAVIATGLVGALFLQPDCSLARWLAVPPLRWLGRISYGLYLWHLPIFILIQRDLHDPRWIIDVVEIACSIAVAAASYYMVERHFLRWKTAFKSV